MVKVSDYRLRRARDIRLVLARGRRMGTELFRIAVHPNGLPHARFVCIISRKVDKRAVVRNHIRRRVREYLCRNHTFLITPLDVALTAEKSAASASRTKLYEVLDEMVGRLSADTAAPHSH